AAVAAALAALTAGANDSSANLLALAVAAGRAKASVGEITQALEQVWGRHEAKVEGIAGIYADGMGKRPDLVAKARDMARAFVENDGRKPK
ncbi:methylmalonyl-CoA mutase family protein, partial [Salmonella enterica]|uniref:methylmalonyl-CoA mutase family protein n=1 Tax=Salmonella enterica TaxID=28901 RepID=UPI003CF7FB83